MIDKQNVFSSLAGDTVTATAISEHVIDLSASGNLNGNTLRDIGTGQPLWLVILVKDTTVSGGSTTCVFTLESDSTADLATSATVHWTSAAIAKATLVAGYVVAKVALPAEATYERYLGLRYTVAVADFSAGSFTAFLTAEPENYTAYQDNRTFV